MHLVVFDIDGTLIESYDFDGECYCRAVADILGIAIDADWQNYRHVTDSGILGQIMDEQKIFIDRELIMSSVKARFLYHLTDYLAGNNVVAIKGAEAFLAQLIKRGDLVVAIATGGWRESAQIKLQAAGFNVEGIFIASASDHCSRIEIMKRAELGAGIGGYSSRTYIGDGPWDLKASHELGYNFVLVGNRTQHFQTVVDFSDVNRVLAYIGL